MREAMELIGVLAVMALVVIGSIFGVWVGISYGIDAPACAKYGQMSSQATYFSLGTSCLVQRSGEWVKYGVAVGEKQEITIKSK